jgi:hypothetical protein
MQTPVIRCTSDPGHGACSAESREPARRASSGHPGKTATWTRLLAHLIVSGLTFAGCVSSPDENSESPSPITADGFPQPANPDEYYTIMASAAASAYPARLDRHTEAEGSVRVLRTDTTFVLRHPLTDASMITTYVDRTTPNRVRVIFAFRGTVHPTLTAPFSNWTDIRTDISSQFFKTRHHNPLVPDHSVGRVGAGWAARWYNVANMRNDVNHEVFKDYIRAIAMQSHHHHIEVNVVGHSLGAVVAELAGFDIEEYFHRNGINYEVNVVAFNPPKLGSEDLVDEYRRRLKARPDRFRISVFTREGDVVDDVPADHIGWLVGHYRQVISNISYDNRTTFCSPYMFKGLDDPAHVGEDGEARRLPYAPRFHATKPFPYGSHSIDHWVGDPNDGIEYRQFWEWIVPRGFRCMFAPNSVGTTERQIPDRPPALKLNCSRYTTRTQPSDCNPSPPPEGRPRDEL